MSGDTAIDLTKLPAPAIVETLDFEQIRSAMIADLQGRDPAFSAVLESDPAMKILEVAAYREVLLRARINDACRAVMLAYAIDSDLDHLAALFQVERQLIDPGDDTKIPPVPATYESNARLRERTQLSLEGHSTAGPEGSYRYHTLAASPRVKDVDVASPEPGKVVVTVLSNEGIGVPDDALIETVSQRLNAKSVRPLTDQVSVRPALLLEYGVGAELHLYDGPDGDLVLQSARQALANYVQTHHRLGHDIPISGLYAALHQPGVQRVVLQYPLADIVVAPNQAAWCESMTLTVAGRAE